MSGGAGDGLASAVAIAMDAAGPMTAPETAAPLLPLLDEHAVEAARDGSPTRDAGQAVERVRKAGRPPGAINKRTGVLRDFILNQYSHPAVVLAQTYSRPVDDLAAQLGCKRIEAFQVQVKAAAELLPYIESKMPVAVGIDARGAISLVLHGADGASGGVVDAQGIEMLGLTAMLHQSEENQGVAE